MRAELSNLSATATVVHPATHPAIVWLGTVASVDPTEFGWKAANLCLSSRIEKRVPSGFAISRHLVARLAEGRATETDLELLRIAWNGLRAEDEFAIVVRSSSSLEDTCTNSFAGLFETTRNVTTFDAFLAAVRRCHAAARSPRVERYAALRGTMILPEHMAVLVQKQIVAQHAALIQVTRSGYLCEAYEGDLADRIQGQGLPDHVLSFRSGRTHVLHSNGRTPHEFLEGLREIADEFEQFAADDHDPRIECLMEIVSDASDLYVLQLNFISQRDKLAIRPPSLELDVDATVLRSDAPTFGVKGAAMKYFHQSELFQSPLWVFAPEATIEDISACIPDRAETAYTVRYSRAADLGLPRGFVVGRDGVRGWVRSSRQQDWATIVHESIDVQSSFELLITADSTLLEHVPGMWESDNSLDPDVIMFDGDTMRAWACKEPRLGRFITEHGVGERFVSATPLSILKAWGKRLMPVVERLRQDFQHALPLNFHFVADSEERWFFLNARRGFNLETLRGAVSGNPYIVRVASDLDGWDRHRPILLRFTTERGSESRILAIAERLMHRRGVPLFIDFGVLSHPALILRELGFTVVPSYLGSGDRLLSPSYRKAEWSLDCGDDPIARIRRENVVYRDRHLRVVRDRDPIVPEHLLVISERSIRSFADSTYANDLAPIIGGELFGVSRQWLFYERGRARFCTSGFTNVHAHGHLLPADRFPTDVVQTLATDLAATQFANIESALRVARQSSEEYALIASSDGGVYLRVLSNGVSLQKQRIRRFLTRRLL